MLVVYPRNRKTRCAAHKANVVGEKEKKGGKEAARILTSQVCAKTANRVLASREIGARCIRCLGNRCAEDSKMATLTPLPLVTDGDRAQREPLQA